MVDMLGQAGHLYEAFDIIKQMPSPPNDSVWGALLLACRIHGNMELGEIAAYRLFQLELNIMDIMCCCGYLCRIKQLARSWEAKTSNEVQGIEETCCFQCD
ncbi:hypothetical protein Ddye_000667 [Dipteronia dyeriana]|uniref:Pentatricopeptide repeat-containing protein n=1 Tax=Dipteronia dyeriana TaxID=168575 RepID=A0AAD9XNH3_9ROSI|nr:hypothetical protein Ddye_000667 [Dipteronia dyeriana]